MYYDPDQWEELYNTFLFLFVFLFNENTYIHTHININNYDSQTDCTENNSEMSVDSHVNQNNVRCLVGRD